MGKVSRGDLSAIHLPSLAQDFPKRCKVEILLRSISGMDWKMIATPVMLDTQVQGVSKIQPLKGLSVRAEIPEFS